MRGTPFAFAALLASAPTLAGAQPPPPPAQTAATAQPQPSAQPVAQPQPAASPQPVTQPQPVAQPLPSAQPLPAASPLPPILVSPPVTPPPYAGYDLDPPVRRSTGMMVAGMILTGVGSVALLAGVAFTGLFASAGGDSGLGIVLIGMPLIAGSTVFAGIGIPLWVVGARPAEPALEAAIPSLSVGPGSASLRWTF